MKLKLQKDEEVLLEVVPEVRVLVIWFFSKCLISVIAVGFLAGAFSFIFVSLKDLMEKGNSVLSTAICVTLLAALVMVAIMFTYCVYLRRTYVYTITNRRCVFSGGILRRTVHSVPFHKITDVEMSQNIVERMLGISSLGIFTPGTGSMGTGTAAGRKPEIAYVGLADNETPAEAINEMLSKFKATGE